MSKFKREEREYAKWLQQVCAECVCQMAAAGVCRVCVPNGCSRYVCVCVDESEFAKRLQQVCAECVRARTRVGVYK